MEQLVALLEATDGFKPAAEMFTKFVGKDKEAESLETKEDRLKRPSGRKQFLGKKVQGEYTAIDTLRDKLPEREEALNRGGDEARRAGGGV